MPIPDENKTTNDKTNIHDLTSWFSNMPTPFQQCLNIKYSQK